jgi:hypothetical protein
MTMFPTVRNQLLQAAQEQARRTATPTLRLGRGFRVALNGVLTVFLVAISLSIGALALVTLSGRHAAPAARPTHIPPPPRSSVTASGHARVHVRVVQGDRYCTARRAGTLELCPKRPDGLVRLGGPSQQWLVIISFIAPRSTVALGPTYYYFTAKASGGCPTAGQFGEYTPAVHKGRRVVFPAAFDKHCPGPGHGAISLVTSPTARHRPGEGVSRPVASFTFVIP